ncbi:MAG TPA: hypothetical protein VGA35_00830 [bacterium]
MSEFATLPSVTGAPVCREIYLTVSPGGLPKWPANEIFANDSTGTIFKIDQNRNVSTFSQLPVCGLEHNALTFDTEGLFGHVLLATCATGHIYKVDRDGSSTLLTLVSETPPFAIEGPYVAPLSFPQYGGDLFVTNEFSGHIVAVAPAGTFTVVQTWPGAEGVNFIPTNVCEFGGSGGAYFRADFTNGAILTSPARDFAGLGGAGLIRSEPVGFTPGAGEAVLDCPSTGACTVTPFGQDVGIQIEGATFVDFSPGCRFNKK